MDKTKRISKIGAWNIKGFRGGTIAELQKTDIYYLGITETKIKGNSTMRLADRLWMIWLGVKKDCFARAGVALIVKKEKIRA